MKFVLTVSCLLLIGIVAGCGSGTSAPATQDEVKAFQADPSKMPADVRQRVQGAQNSRPANVPR